MEDEEKKIRHTISAEETFTLAKDVFDMRTFIKNVYANRAVIARRLNIITLCVSIIYTMLYASYALYKIFKTNVSFAQQIVVYSFIGVYAVAVLLLFILILLSSRATTKSLKKFSLSLSIIRLIIKLVSIAMAISAIAISISKGNESYSMALDITIIVFSIISMIMISLPMFFGGLGKFIRWLLSPVKTKQRFSTVVMEWYELAVTGEPTKGSRNKVAKKHYGTIEKLIDETLVPAIGKKYINTIKAVTILNIVENCSEEDRPVLEGVLKSVFAYATECGYVVFDPTRDLNLEGSVEVEKKKSIKERFMGIGAKFGKKMLDKYIGDSETAEE